MKTTRYGTPLLHIAAWTAFILYELTAVFFINGVYASRIGITLFYYIPYIALFYLHAFAILPWTTPMRRRLFWRIGLVLAEIIACLAIKYVLDKILVHFQLPRGNSRAVIRYLFLGCWRALWFIGLATVYWLIQTMFDYREQINTAEKQRLAGINERISLEKKMADLHFAFLQQQINPHFLFNTLNFVYSAVLKLSPGVAETIGRLSEVVRYGLLSPGFATKTPLSGELAQIRNLVALNRARYDFELYLDERYEGNFEELRILPLVLLTFTENLFKHGDLTNPRHPAKIDLAVDAGRILRFETSNFRKRSKDFAAAGGTGIANTIKRLDYAYGKQYQLDIIDQEDHFRLTLTIEL